MKKWLTILLCVYATIGYGQLYESNRLQQMGTALRIASVCDTIMRDTCLIVKHHNHPVRVNIDSDHVITHVGFCIFPDSLSLYPDYIERFLERYMLELALPSSTGIPMQQKMHDDGVWFDKGTYEDIISMNLQDTSHATSLTESDKGYCFTTSQNGIITAQFMFPKDVQLIRGKDKIELDQELFANKLQNHRPSVPIDTTRLQKIPFASYMKLSETYYLSESLSNTLLVQKKKGQFSIVHSPYMLPKHTLQNLMIAGSDSAIDVRMEHHRYGYSTVADTLSLNAWLNIAYADGCTPYWGVVSFDVEAINGSYIWVNESLGYLHVLFVRFPLKVLWGKDGMVKCSLHSYVRMSNVTDLFYNNEHAL